MCERQDEVGVGWSVVDRATFDRRVHVSRLVKYTGRVRTQAAG